MDVVNRMSLDGRWTLYYFRQNEQKIDGPEQLIASGVAAIDAQVPGNVELDLQRAGIIDDPFYANNIHGLRPYEFYEWWYEREFETPSVLPGQSVELLFHGVDCLATYWLNGECIGSSDNMFIEHRFDVSDKLKRSASNRLTIRLRSPILEAMDKDLYPHMSALPGVTEQLWIRKAPSSYGWDIMPRAVSAGLWRSVELVIHDSNEIEDLYFVTTSARDKMATVSVFYHVKVDPQYLDDLHLRVRGQCGDSTFESATKITFNRGTIQFAIANPKLWWPKGYGDASLYDVTAELVHGDAVIATSQYTVGIRTLELIRSELAGEENGGQFMFRVNHTPIMCKGSNWVPADAFHSRDAGRYEDILALFADLGCNILRCWGGSVYEDHRFFDLCDRYGILVWQDFAMACAAYPQHEEFYKAIESEAESVIRKLRNHPSLAVWCGDNECDYNYTNYGLDPGKNKITREVLPGVVFRNDPFRPFIPTSPYFSPAVFARKDSDLLPENHLWGPRDYYKGRFYTESKAHFVGETGYHGCPNISSIKRFIDEDHLWPWEDNDQWITHCTTTGGKTGPYAYRVKLMADQIKEMFGIYPDNLEDFVLASQISQAEAKKFFIELTRLKKWRRTGVIWWNVMDGWPQFSDAIVDYYFGKKLAYHYIKRVQKATCIMVAEPDNWHVRVVAGNDSNEGWQGEYRVWDADTDETLLAGSLQVRANENATLGHIRVSRGDHRLFLIEWTANGEKMGNHYLLGMPPFDLDRYKRWLEKIAAMPDGFDASSVGQ